MAALLTRRKLGSESGQTSVEYLMLLAVAFVVAYLLAVGPFATFTRIMLLRIRAVLVNVVQNGELQEGNVLGPGQSGHPGDQQRFKALHL